MTADTDTMLGIVCRSCFRGGGDDSARAPGSLQERDRSQNHHAAPAGFHVREYDRGRDDGAPSVDGSGQV